MKFVVKEYPELLEKVEQMSVRELLKAVGGPSTTEDRRDMEKGYPSVFIHPSSKEKMLAHQEHYLKDNDVEVVFSEDTECGSGGVIEGSVRFTTMMGMGVAGDPELAYKVGRIAARDSVAAGFRWSLSPCVDIVYDEESPMVSTRSAGKDAQTVIDIAGAYMRGLQDGGVAATLKHFPGDGVSRFDQHITTSVNALPIDEWRQTYGRIYKELIEQGAMCVMPGHISLPSYDVPDPELGLCPPGTLSYRLMTDMLRKELGFEGIICSDAFSMGGSVGFMNYYKACATFLKNGGDTIFFPRTDDRYFEKMEELVNNGFLPLDVLKNRAYRMLCFSHYVNTEFQPKEPIDVDANALAEELVRKSMTVIRDRKQVLPFKADENTKILVVDFSNSYATNDLGKAGCDWELYEMLKAKGYQVDHWYDPGSERLFQAADLGLYDLILCTVKNHLAYGTNILRLHGSLARNMMDGWTKTDTPVVFICYNHPYFYNEYEAQVDTVINTYGVADTTNEVVIEKIFGAEK